MQAPPSVDILRGTIDGVGESDDPQTRNSKAADLVVNGVVVETKLCVYGKVSVVQFLKSVMVM